MTTTPRNNASRTAAAKPKTPVERKAHWVGFDLGGTKMMAEIYDANFKTIASTKKKTKGHEGMSSGLKRIAATIDEALLDAGLNSAQLGGIGIGCPGPLDLKQGVIHDAPNLGWKNVPVKKTLESRFGCPVVVANDVDSGTFGEYEFGAGKRARCVVGLFPGTGIGGGCVYEGKLLQGANCTCMEIGHIPLLPGGPIDGAGNNGSLESIASRLAISGLAAQAAFRGQAPALMANCGTSIERIRSGDLADAIREGDRFVAKIVEQAAEYLALGLVTVVHILAPDIVVLGGGLVDAMPDLYLGTVRSAFRKRVLPAYRDLVEIVPAQLGDRATVKGAAAWARRQIAS